MMFMNCPRAFKQCDCERSINSRSETYETQSASHRSVVQIADIAIANIIAGKCGSSHNEMARVRRDKYMFGRVYHASRNSNSPARTMRQSKCALSLRNGS